MMKKLLLAACLFVGIAASAQYTTINSGYDWIRGKFRALNIPFGCGYPSLQTGQYQGSSAIYLDTCFTGGRGRLYYKQAGTWQAVMDSTTIAGLIAAGGGGGADLSGIRDSIAAIYDTLVNHNARIIALGSGGGGSSNVFSEGLKTRGDTAVIDNKRLIYYITQPTTGSSLSGFTAVGTPTYSVTNGVIQVNSNTATGYTQYIRSDKATMAEGTYIEMSVKVDSLRSNSDGPRLGWKSLNTYSGGIYQHDVWAGAALGSGVTSSGKAFIYGKTGNSTTYGDSARVTYDGDSLVYRLYREALSYRVVIRNVTQNWIITHRVQTTPAGSPFVAHNTAYPAFAPGGGGYKISNFKYVIEAPLRTQYLIAGNSITMGQGAANENARYAANIGNRNNNIIAGGGADGTAEMFATIGEKIAINPEALILMIGGNDILFGVSSSTWRANYQAIRDSLFSRGVNIIHLLPTPRTGTDVTPLKNWIDTLTAFRGDRKIDTYTPLWSGSSYTLATNYSADGTHPNSAGHAQVAATVNDYISAPNASMFVVMKNLYAYNGYGRFRDNGTGADQFGAGGVQVHSVSDTNKVIQMGYDGSGGYIQAYTRASTYDNIRINPAGASKVAFGNAHMGTARVSIRDVTNGTAEALAISHGGSYSANDQEFQVSLYNGGTKVTTIANYLHSSSKFGWKFYTYGGSLQNTSPAMTLTGDNTVGIKSTAPLFDLDVNGTMALRNAPTGTSTDSLLMLEDGQVKRIDATALPFVSQSALNDTASAIRATIGSGGGGGTASTIFNTPNGAILSNTTLKALGTVNLNAMGDSTDTDNQAYVRLDAANNTAKMGSLSSGAGVDITADDGTMVATDTRATKDGIVYGGTYDFTNPLSIPSRAKVSSMINDSLNANSKTIRAAKKTNYDTLATNFEDTALVIKAVRHQINGVDANKTIDDTSALFNHIIDKTTVGLGNVDNTSDATKNSATATLTNKRWTPRVGSTTSSATPTINTDNVDIYKLTAQAADITSFTTNLSGTPVDGDILEIQITGTATRAITWGSSFVSSTVTLPTTTSSTATLTVVLQYFTTSSYGNNKWVCVNSF